MSKCYCKRYATFKCCCWCGVPFDCACNDKSCILKCAECYFRELHLMVPKTDSNAFLAFHTNILRFADVMREYPRLAPKNLEQQMVRGLFEYLKIELKF